MPRYIIGLRALCSADSDSKPRKLTAFPKHRCQMLRCKMESVSETRYQIARKRRSADKITFMLEWTYIGKIWFFKSARKKQAAIWKSCCYRCYGGQANLSNQVISEERGLLTSNHNKTRIAAGKRWTAGYGDFINPIDWSEYRNNLIKYMAEEARRMGSFVNRAS